MEHLSEEHILAWYQENKRDLPWRGTKDPYHIWVSEIMLQQTQVSRVLEYYQNFLARFPDIFSLSKSSWGEFLPYWKGLGFYSRGRNMLKTAIAIVQKYEGIFPSDQKTLEMLSGIGPYTSAAILSFSKNMPLPALDTNLFRVLSRFWDISESAVKQIAEKEYTEFSAPDLINHALMDIGATICGSQKTICEACPLHEKCQFFASGKQKNLKKESVKKAKEPKISKEFSVAAIHHEQKYLFIKKGEKWGFPSFLREKGRDHRHLLQEKFLEKFGIQVSVRPPFWSGVFEEEKEYWKIRCSRVQILGDNLPKGKNLLWIAPQNFADFMMEEALLPVLEILKTMRFPPKK